MIQFLYAKCTYDHSREVDRLDPGWWGRVGQCGSRYPPLEILPGNSSDYAPFILPDRF